MSQGVLEGWYSKQRREEEEAAAQGEPCAGVEGEQPPACLIEGAGWILSPRGTSQPPCKRLDQLVVCSVGSG